MKLAHENLLSAKEVADIMELQQAGYIGSDLDLTDMGERVLVRLFLFGEYKDKLVAKAKAKNAENEE